MALHYFIKTEIIIGQLLQIVHDRIKVFAGIRAKQFGLLLSCPACTNAFPSGITCHRCYGRHPAFLKASGIPRSLRTQINFDVYMDVIEKQELKYGTLTSIQSVDNQPSILSTQRLLFHALDTRRYWLPNNQGSYAFGDFRIKDAAA